MANIIGIDVSEHNGKLDWAKIKAAGIQFAIIRSGYGVSHTDAQFKNNMADALAQGIPVGIYHFSYALNEAGAKNEAAFVVSLLAPYKDKITLPVFFDFEYDTISYAAKQGVTLGKTAFNTHTVAFCEHIKAAGYVPGTYYNLDYFSRYVDKAKIGSYVQWYAQYASKASISDYDFWQYSSSLTISGNSGRFDVNVLKNTALLSGATPAAPKVKPGWQKNDTGWWYVHEDSSYTKLGWEKIDGKWYYFDENGYMVADKWAVGYTGSYYLGADGAMVTNKTLKVDADGRLVPAGEYYYKLGDVPAAYRDVLDKVIAKGIIAGRSGTGDDLVLDMSEDAVRLIVILSRSGVFGE